MLGCKSKKGQEQKTKHIDKTLEPTWNHKYHPIPYDNEDYSALHCILFDKDTVGSDDFMGQIIVPIYEIKNAGGKLDKWYQLVTNEAGDNVSGSIHLVFEMTSDEEVERKRVEEQKRIEEERRIKQEEETRIKLEEQEKQIQIINEKRKQMEEEKQLKLSQNIQKPLTTNVPPPISQNRVGNASCVVAFIGQSQTELSMNLGDDITIQDRSDPHWWYAKNNTSGLEGYIPATGGYVSGVSSTSTKQGNSTCTMSFVGQSQTELSMNIGDDITIDDKSDPNWWYAKNHTTGQEGYVPAVGGYVN